MNEPWKFEDGQWQGPMWPIKALYWSCYGLLLSILLMMIAFLGVTVVSMLGLL